MLNRIPTRLSVSILAFLGLILVTALATGYYLKAQQYNALQLNVVLRQGTHVADLTGEVAAYSPDAKPRIEKLQSSIDGELKVLMDGGYVAVGPETKPCLAVESDGVREQLKQAGVRWTAMKNAVSAFIASNGENRAERDAVLSGQAELRGMLEAAATEQQRFADAKMNQLFWIQSATSAAGIVLVFVILWATRRDIGVPLQRLVQAAERMSTGDMSTPISTLGLAEISALAESFERLRLSVKAITEEAEDALPGGKGGAAGDELAGL